MTGTDRLVALHGTHRLEPGEWWACEHPERPPEHDRTAYCIRCRSCLIALDAARRNGSLDHLRRVTSA